MTFFLNRSLWHASFHNNRSESVTKKSIKINHDCCQDNYTSYFMGIRYTVKVKIGFYVSLNSQGHTRTGGDICHLWSQAHREVTACH